MNFLKIILGIFGIALGLMLFFWLFGWISTILWYGFLVALIGGVGYGAYKLFIGAERKALGYETRGAFPEARDYDLSWDEYEKKYLNK